MIDIAAIGGPVGDLASTQLASTDVDKQMFLKLLVTSLKAQDPFDPMKNEDFLAQLAQFSSLETLNSINSNMDNANLLTNSVHNALSTSLIGNYGVTAGNTVTVDRGEPTDVIYVTPEGEGVKITIKDSAGEVVTSFERGDNASGDNGLNWDGLDADGKAVANGKYTVEVEILEGASAGQPVNLFQVGRIRAVRFFAGSPVVVIGSQEYLLSDLLEVNEGNPVADADDQN